jgi:quinol monooxygenase YgiN
VSIPIVYVDHSDVRAGRLAELKTALAELASFVEANEPQLVAYDVYFNPSGTEITVIHVHRDATSLDAHMEIAGPRFGRFADLVELRRIDIYGDPSERALQQLRAKAALLGDGSVSVNPFHAGFVRIAVAERVGGS